MDDFVHLHLHTEYSLLDGACLISRLFDKAKEVGQKAVAITDHGVLYGAVEFYKAAKNAGIKPVIGCEVYLAKRTRFDRDVRFDREQNHLILLCKNMTGYKNLIKLVSLSFTEGFYSKPRVDTELLERYHEGLIALSACLAGRIPSLILENEYEKAKEHAEEMRRIFGEGNFFLEIQNHGLREELQVIHGITEISKATGIELVATNDVHYVDKKDAESQQILMCIQTNTTVSDENKMELGTDEFYFKSADEMKSALPGHPEAIANTVRIADMCSVDFEFDKRYLPGFTPPDGQTPKDYLYSLCKSGLERRLGENAYAAEKREEYEKRLDYELSVVSRMGFCEYYLIVNDFVSYAKRHGIYVGPGRGSGAGSLAAWCLGITDVDPIRYGLIFERFLNPERVSMPDFDIDFCYERRHEVIEYVISKYGADHVSQIITFNTMAARAVVRDVGRALGLPYAQVDEAAKLIGHDFGATLDKALTENEKFKALYASSPDIKRLVDIAKTLEGMPRHASIHAAGVVITDKPVSDYVPLSLSSGSVVTQFPMNTIADLGLLKIDFLGLRYLTVIRDAVELIRKKEPDFSVEKIPYDDRETFEMISSGNTMGVFQLESGGMRNLLMQMKPENIEDITAVIALYRPGPMDSIPKFLANRKNRENIVYDDEKLKDILDVTNGCIVYQEQVMEIFRSLAGYSYGRADLIRRAMSKKKQSEMIKERSSFIYGEPDVRYAKKDEKIVIDGAVRRGVNEEAAGRIFDDMADFANYAFNKSHACAYSFVTYRTAYLKCKYPGEYLAARLNAALIDGKLSYYIDECARLGIEVLPPDINESENGFSCADGKMRFGLSGVKNVGENFIRDIYGERSRRPFSSFEDFMNRMSSYGLNRRMVESLVMAGAFDSFGVERNRLIAVIDSAIEAMAEIKRRNISGQLDIFSSAEERDDAGMITLEYPELPAMTPGERLSMEKEVCGMYLSGHPLSGYEYPEGAVRIADITEQGDDGGFSDGDEVTVLGMVTAKKIKTAKSGSRYAFADIEDQTGKIEAIVFEKILAKYDGLIAPERVVAVTGTLSLKEDETKLIVKTVQSGVKKGAYPYAKAEDGDDRKRRFLPEAGKNERHTDEKNEKTRGNAPEAEKNGDGGQNFAPAKKIYLRLPTKRVKMERRILSLLGIFEGDCEVFIYYSDEKKYFRLSGAGCSGSDFLVKELKELLGDGNVEIKR